MDILTELRSLRQAFEAATQKFADYKVSDELTIRIEGDPVAGASVFVVDAEGNASPAPDGEHMIPELGTIVTSGGVISEVKMADVADTAAAVEEVAAVVEEVAPEAPAEVVAAVSAEAVAEIMEKLSNMASTIEEMKQELGGYKDREKKMFAIVEQLASQPAPEPTQKATHAFSKAPSNDFNQIAKAIKQLKK